MDVAVLAMEQFKTDSDKAAHELVSLAAECPRAFLVLTNETTCDLKHDGKISTSLTCQTVLSG
jgi:hypothetical protein